MLRVRIDNRDVTVMPISLAQMVFDGRLDRHDRAKASDGATEQPLEYALGAAYAEAMVEELLVRLRSMYRRSATAESIDRLRRRVEALSQWHWDQPTIHARLLWSVAWLNELTERFEPAVGYYDAFLQTRCREGHLRRLAYNNRGVLSIRLGRLEGVADLARAAVGGERNGTAPTTGLPAACFNLLNLINVAADVESLREAVDAALVEFFAELSEEARGHWLGADSASRVRDDDKVCIAQGASSASDNGDGSVPEFSIVGDPTHRSLNRLLSNLARAAQAMEETAAGVDSEAADGCDGLRLWGEGSSGPGHPHAEAAALLLSDQIPSSLISRDRPGRRAEQSVQEELAEIENLVAGGHFELARSRLGVQRKILAALDHRDHSGELLARVDAELQWIEHSEKELEQLRLQRACAAMVSEVEQFCTLTSLAAAERRLADLQRELSDQRARLGPAAGTEFTGLLDELALRAERHMARLRRLEVRRRVRPELRELRRLWPGDWSMPVPDAAYAALAHCQLNDPGGEVEDWLRLREQLDAHQAHHRLRGALSALPNRGGSWEQAEGALAEALRLCPDSWRTIAPLFGLPSESGPTESSGAGLEMRTALETGAAGLLSDSPSGTNGSAARRQSELLQRAGGLLDRSFRQLHEDPQRFTRLWAGVRETLGAALGGASADVVAAIGAVARTCLDHWPSRKTGLAARSDPRNPVRLFLESCEKVRCLATAEEMLDTEPAKTKAAGEYVGWAIGMGLDDSDQAARAARCLYLAGPGAEDAAAIQRRVLDSIDAWAEALSAEEVHGITNQEIIRQIEAAKADLRGGLASAAEDAATSGRRSVPDV
jgi:hypothetical protein